MMEIDFLLGTTHRTATPLHWAERGLINPHMVIAGSSGSGKTTMLIRVGSTIGSAFRQRGKGRICVVDSHGDMEFPEHLVSRVKFGVSKPYGLNPLALSGDVEDGGPLMKADGFISLLRRSTGAIGAKQEAVLRHLLADLYEAHGILHDAPATWSRPNGPTIASLHEFVTQKLRHITLGLTSSAGLAFDAYLIAKTKLARVAKSHTKGDAQDSDLMIARTEALEAYQQMVDDIDQPFVEERMKYYSVDVMQSVADRVANLNASGAFGSETPPFDTNKRIWVHDIKGMSDTAAMIFVDTLGCYIFQGVKASGLSSYIRSVFMIDEAGRFTTEDRDNILNRIAGEGRKFGLMLMIADQSLLKIPTDMVDSSATICLLGVTPTRLKQTANKLGLTAEELSSIVPKKTALLSLQQSEQPHAFNTIDLPALPRSNNEAA